MKKRRRLPKAPTCPRPNEHKTSCLDGRLEVKVESARDMSPTGTPQLFWLRVKGERVDARIYLPLAEAERVHAELGERIAAARAHLIEVQANWEAEDRELAQMELEVTAAAEDDRSKEAPAV